MAQLREQVQAERRKWPKTRRAGWKAFLKATGTTPLCARRWRESKAETQRVRSKYEGRLEEMEREVELYAEMMAEMKRAAAAENAPNRSYSPAPTRKVGLPGWRLTLKKKRSEKRFFFYP